MKVIIDTDIGDDIDDAYAIELALKTPSLEILGVTTAFRNSEKRAKIVKALLASNGRTEIPVYAGIDAPMAQNIKPLTYETEVQRDEDGVCVPHFRREFEKYRSDGDAVEFLLSAAEKYPDEICVICLAPLTNVATAYQKSPAAFRKFKNIVMMGGQANGTYAEWNFRCDPEAAKIVFDSGLPIRMVGINVTKYCVLNEEARAELSLEHSESGKLLGEMLKKWIADNRGEKQPTMHDALAVAEATRKFCEYETKRAAVSIEENNRGMVCAGEMPVEMATDVNEKEFLGYFLSRLRRKI